MIAYVTLANNTQVLASPKAETKKADHLFSLKKYAEMYLPHIAIKSKIQEDMNNCRYFLRLNELTCGSSNEEDFVCCPSCECGRVYQHGNPECGQSMVRGIDYNGLGAQPWVARVGFASQYDAFMITVKLKASQEIKLWVLCFEVQSHKHTQAVHGNFYFFIIHLRL